MRIARVLVPLVTMAVVAAACGGTPTSAPTAAAATPTPKPSPVKIKSSYGNVTPSNLAPFMAKELAIFEKYNLDVTLDLIDGGVASSAALVSGQVQVGNFGGTEAMSLYAGGGEAVVVALFVPVTPWQLLAAAMLGGAAYAGPGHPPDTVKLLANGFKPIVDLASQKILATDNCTIVLRSWADKNPQALQAYVDAEIEAIAIAKKDKAKTLPILAKLLKLDMAKPDDASAVTQTYDFYVTGIFPSYPHPLVAPFNASRDALVATNPNVKDLDVSKVIDDKYVADAEKRGVGK